MRQLAAVLFSFSVCAAAPATAHAQVQIGVGGGPVTAVGDFGDGVDTGFHGGVVLQAGIPLLPVALRADLMYQRFNLAGTTGNVNEVFGTVNGRFDVLPVPMLAAYLTAGAGLYSSRAGGDDIDGSRTTDFGVNGGVGASANLIMVRPFVEIRYHRVLSDPARGFIPITVGVFF